MAKRVFAIVLAAGSASRFGTVKQLAAVGDVAMVARAVATANDVCGDRTALVVGHEPVAVATACHGKPGFLIVNDDYEQGIGTSIAAAVQRVRHVADAVLVMLADQPLVTAEHLRSLIDVWDGSQKSIVATQFAGTSGPPVLFAGGCFDDLADLEGDNGGRKLLSDPQYQVTTVGFEPAAIDIDTVDDLTSLRGA